MLLPRRALQWAASACDGLRGEMEPLFHPDYKGARENIGQRSEEHTLRFVYVVTFVGMLQMLFDPHATMRAYFVMFVSVNGALQVLLPKHVNLLSVSAATTGMLTVAFRMHVLEKEFYTMGYDKMAIWVGPIGCVGLGARLGASMSVTSYFLLRIHASDSAAHVLSSARVVLILSALSSLLSEAKRVREEFVSERLRERTAEARSFEMQAAAAKAEVAHARAAQLAAEAEKARAAKLRAEDQRRAMERLYHKALTQVKVPLVLARSEMQACRTRQCCPGCYAAEQRINELWQLLTAPIGASRSTDDRDDDGASGPRRAGDEGRAPLHAGAAEGGSLRDGSCSPPPSAASASSGNWSYDGLHEFRDVAIAFDAEDLSLQRVVVNLREPGAQSKRPTPRLDQWVVPEEWQRAEGWIQHQVNAVLNGRPTQDYGSPLCLRWPGEAFVQVKAASIAWVEEPLEPAWGRGDETGEGGDDCSNDQARACSADGSADSYCDGHFALLLSEFSVPVPSRQRHRRRRQHHHHQRRAPHPQGSRLGLLKSENTDIARVPQQLDCVEEFCSLADDTEGGAGGAGEGEAGAEAGDIVEKDTS